MIIRDFVEEDAQAILELYFLAVHELNKEFYSEEQLAAWTENRSVEGTIKAAKECDDYLVAEKDGEVLGFGCRRNDKLQALYVHPSAARQGVGSALLEELLGRIREEGFLCVRAESSLGAQAFYERRGFRAIKQSTVSVSSIDIPCVIIQKLL